MILVGGFGTRLGSLTEDCPKPLLPVAGKPFLAHLMDNLRHFGFNRFILLAGYKADQIRRFALAYEHLHNVQATVLTEEDPAGTAGGLLLARDCLHDEFVLLNGDTFFDFNLLDLGSRPTEFDWIGRIALREVNDASRFGRVTMAGDRISTMREKSGDGQGGLINGGTYWLKREVLDFIAHSPCSMEHDVLPRLIESGNLAGFTYSGPFIDIGIPADLDFVRQNWLEFIRKPATFFDRDGVLNHDDGYTHRIDGFRWIDGAKAAIKRCNDEGRYVFVVTNQAGVARGYYDEAAVRELHAWMNEDLRSIGAHIDAFRYCPHHREGTIPDYARDCDWRKPNPGMILDILKNWQVDKAQSVLLGDKQSDIDAAAAAGIAGVLL